MYTIEELKVIGGLIMFALIGRLLFYRELHNTGTFREKLQCRLVSWLWEIPVLVFFGTMALVIMERFTLTNAEGNFIALVGAYFGLETVKIWMYDWFNSRWGVKKGKVPPAGRSEETDNIE